jgi:hypothetical protein
MRRANQLIRASLNKILQKATHQIKYITYIRLQTGEKMYTKSEGKPCNYVLFAHFYELFPHFQIFLGSKCQYNTPISAKQNSNNKLKWVS